METLVFLDKFIVLNAALRQYTLQRAERNNIASPIENILDVGRVLQALSHVFKAALSHANFSFHLEWTDEHSNTGHSSVHNIFGHTYIPLSETEQGMSGTACHALKASMRHLVDGKNVVKTRMFLNIWIFYRLLEWRLHVEDLWTSSMFTFCKSFHRCTDHTVLFFNYNYILEKNLITGNTSAFFVTAADAELRAAILKRINYLNAFHQTTKFCL